METQKEFYTIQEVQSKTQLPASTLRYWETQFEELSPKKDGHGNRFYKKEDIEFIQTVRYIRDELKITRIEAIKRKLRLDGKNGKKATAQQQSIEMLRKIRHILVEMRDNLNP